jgi:hypothetical protein
VNVRVGSMGNVPSDLSPGIARPQDRDQEANRGVDFVAVQRGSTRWRCRAGATTRPGKGADR